MKRQPLPDNPTNSDLARGQGELHECLEEHKRETAIGFRAAQTSRDRIASGLKAIGSKTDARFDAVLESQSETTRRVEDVAEKVAEIGAVIAPWQKLQKELRRVFWGALAAAIFAAASAGGTLGVKLLWPAQAPVTKGYIDSRTSSRYTAQDAARDHAAQAERDAARDAAAAERDAALMRAIEALQPKHKGQ